MGDPIHYVMDTVDTPEQFRDKVVGKHRFGYISNDFKGTDAEKDGIANLHVFTDKYNDGLTVASFWKPGAKYSEKGEPGTFHAADFAIDGDGVSSAVNDLTIQRHVTPEQSQTTN